jgi:hypothetical protein
MKKSAAVTQRMHHFILDYKIKGKINSLQFFDRFTVVLTTFFKYSCMKILHWIIINLRWKKSKKKYCVFVFLLHLTISFFLRWILSILICAAVVNIDELEQWKYNYFEMILFTEEFPVLICNLIYLLSIRRKKIILKEHHRIFCLFSINSFLWNKQYERHLNHFSCCCCQWKHVYSKQKMSYERSKTAAMQRYLLR